jgi:hypothetical protein
MEPSRTLSGGEASSAEAYTAEAEAAGNSSGADRRKGGDHTRGAAAAGENSHAVGWDVRGLPRRLSNAPLPHS